MTRGRNLERNQTYPLSDPDCEIIIEIITLYKSDSVLKKRLYDVYYSGY